MAKTLLNGVNELLKKVESIDSDGALTSLTDSARQTWIDGAIQALNETVDLLYELPRTPQRPKQMAEATITLAASDQDYPMQSDMVRLIPEYGLIDETNNHVIHIDDSPDGYRKLVIGDLDQDDTGLPDVAVIRPTDGQLWMNRAPTSSEAGRVYKYRFEKEGGLVNATDVFPFTEPVFRAVIVAASEQYGRLKNNLFDERYFNRWLGIAASRLSQFPRQRSYLTTGAAVNATDPFEA